MIKETKTDRPTINEMRKRMTDLGEEVLWDGEYDKEVYCVSVRYHGPRKYGIHAVELRWRDGWYSEKNNIKTGHPWEGTEHCLRHRDEDDHTCVNGNIYCYYNNTENVCLFHPRIKKLGGFDSPQRHKNKI